MSYFMMEEFARDETLNSIMTRLRGRYAVLAHLEGESKKPDSEKIQSYSERGKEISKLLRTIFYEPIDFKEAAISKFSNELKELMQSS
ncbi:MAG: hypothetical protein JSS79_18170 [Bacteroidetes bacterium]|nr:hypothetical protein [Bacteroidota bacterium]